jgi:hypothetical protein
MTQISLQELRRIADSLTTLRGRTVVSAVMRSDQRQLRIELADGHLVVSVPTRIPAAGPAWRWTSCGGRPSSTSSRFASKVLEGVGGIALATLRLRGPVFSHWDRPSRRQYDPN